MLPSGKGYALDISSLKRICSGHILFEEDMLRTYPLWQRICSYPLKRGYAQSRHIQWQRICTGHILFEEDMLSQEGICSPVAKDMHWTYPL
jgi:hypothetical protein